MDGQHWSFRTRDASTGDSGTGDSGTGDSGTGDSGTGDPGTGDAGTRGAERGGVGGVGVTTALRTAPQPRTRHDEGDAYARALQRRVATMRAGGMSATAIRRALGLTAREAVAAGLESPRAWQEALARPVGPVVPAEPRYSADGRRHDLRMSDVMQAVCDVTGIASERILGRAQDRRHAGARHLLMHLLRELCAGASYPTIGFFVQRDHTTVLYGCRRAQGLIEHDRDFRAVYHRIRKALQA